MAKAWSWSYSALKGFENCQKRYYHLNVLKDIKEPETQQLIDGNRLHDVFAKRIMKGTALPLGFGMHEPMLAAIANAGRTKELAVEQKLAINAQFQPTQYFADDVWFRSVIDAAVIGQTTAGIFDWKTGKYDDDETQLKLMALVTFAYLPNVQTVHAGLYFVNYGSEFKCSFSRADVAEHWNDILPRVALMRKALSTQEFPPKPSGLCKRYCPVVSCPHHGR